MRSSVSYAVLNQICTVNASRFIALKQGNSRIDVPLDKNTINELLSFVIDDIVFTVKSNDKINMLKKSYDKACKDEAINLAYSVLKLQMANKFMLLFQQICAIV